MSINTILLIKPASALQKTAVYGILLLHTDVVTLYCLIIILFTTKEQKMNCLFYCMMTSSGIINHSFSIFIRSGLYFIKVIISLSLIYLNTNIQMTK
jgi:hypothetical protein